MNQDPIVIVGAARTPIGAFRGVFNNVSATRLGAVAIQAAVERAGLDPAAVNEVLMGNCLSAGLRQAPARQAAIGAGLPASAGCTTLSKMCGSGMKTVMLGHDLLVAGSADVVVAGGMESMTNAPHLLLKGRSGIRAGHDSVMDHMFYDGLEDAYEPGKLMGHFAEDWAGKYGFSREDQDDFALESLRRAQSALESGAFASEVAPVHIADRRGDVVVDEDETPKKAKPEKVRLLKPGFSKDGTITAANASSISDGAAALALTRLSTAQKMGLPVKARILGHTTYAQAPSDFCTAPIPAVRSLLQKVNWEASDVDLFEINEAFAMVTMAAIKDLELSPDRVNVYGGACALGHPIGATGARLMVTLLSALEQKQLKRGVAALCIGGGEATAIAIELVD